MKSISHDIGNKPIDLVFGLSSLGIGSYNPRPLDLGSGSVSSGMQTLIDRFVITLFNQAGSTKHDEFFGTNLIGDVVVGSAMNFGLVQSAVAIAVESAMSQIQSDDAESSVPLDAQLESAVCESVEYDTKTGTLRLYVSLTSRAGEDYIYTLPVNLALLR